ncbi:MAG: YraN family protein [candidate division Zixibacteria bacterium]|jgi:putative endonuclease|nr:YraN family protein [candidate division Zixibacteria bacterium]
MSSSKDKKKPPSRQQRVGRRYEDQAAAFYQRQGFAIVARNWRSGHKEIDLIVRRAELLVFVEVKASMSQEFGHPAARIDATKMKNLSSAAQAYMVEEGIDTCDCRFDVVTFFEGRLEHYPDAFPFTD